MLLRTLSELVQLIKELLAVSLLAGIRKTFQMDVRPSRFAPFDIYFLMDLSHSLANDLATIRNLTSDIGKLAAFGNVSW